jgi:hypothetical protein
MAPLATRSRVAIVIATALMISATAARTDTATAQTVNPAGRVETLIVPTSEPIVPPLTEVLDPSTDP